MKILHVCKKYPSSPGGDAVVVANLQRQQEAANHRVAIVTSNCDEIKNGDHIYKVGLRDTPSGLDAITPRRLLSLLVLAVRMFGILAKERPDVIHTHSIDMAFFVSFAARFYHIPVVHTFHIVTFYDSSQSALRRKTELWLAKGARLRCATAPNSYDVKMLQEAGLEKTILLPNGVDMSYWDISDRANLPAHDTFTFISVGRLEQQKGYDYFIKAAALLAREQPNRAFRINIIGDGSQKKTLEALARAQHVDHIVSLLGSKSHDDIKELLGQASAAVYPSLYETTPLTLLEAWAAGLPVIMTSVGILRDAAPDFEAAYIVPPQNEQALMQAMRQCLSDQPTRQIIAAKGHEEAKKYTWPIISQTAEAMYQGAR
ncbi:MAG TPA: glycosyltransferase family 4 protein [Candidatus Acidoferrum sp.]|nr:glycosyltransferase family 4 protein [Candidatus Acidoferrum sp.]